MIRGGHNELIIADTGNSRVIRITSNGELIQVLGREGRGPGEFTAPSDLALDDKTGILWVGERDPTNRVISRFTLGEKSAEFIERFPAPQSMMFTRTLPSLVPVGNNSYWSNIWFSARANESTLRIHFMSRDGTRLRSFGERWSHETVQDGMLYLMNEGTLIEVGESYLVFAWLMRPIVELWNTSGELIQTQQIITDQLTEDMATPDPDGTMWMYFYDAVWSEESERLYLVYYERHVAHLWIYALNIPDLSLREVYVYHQPENEDSHVIARSIVPYGSAREPVFYALDSTTSAVVVMQPISNSRQR